MLEITSMHFFENITMLGENMDTKADRTELENYATKAELEVLPGVGVKATIRSGTKPLLECEQCYSTFVDVDIGGIKYVKIETRTSGVAFTSGNFTVYGR